MIDDTPHAMYYIGDRFLPEVFLRTQQAGREPESSSPPAANTLLLLQDMPDVSHERRRELVEQIENFVATLKDPYCKALAETRGLMVQLRKQSEVER